jgi:hypothetical protein
MNAVVDELRATTADAFPIHRYGIDERTTGLPYGDDRSLILAVPPKAPSDPAQRANWLPAPSWPFTAIFRLYRPHLRWSTAAARNR